MIDLTKLGKDAKIASKNLLKKDQATLNKVLITLADLLEEQKEFLKEQNNLDIEYAKEKGQSAGFIDRLTLTDKVILGMAEGVRQVANLNSPVGKLLYEYKNLEQNISVEKRAVPFGVVGMIYESRPNVTIDAFSLSLKTSNAVILKGGSDAMNSNKALVSVIKQALKVNDVDQNAVTLIEDTDRETTKQFMKLNKYVDLLIPRGGAGLIKSAIENSTIPIIETGTGNCHIYVDKSADISSVASVIFNAKTQRYSVCNACESLVIHSEILSEVLPLIYNKLQEKDVEMRLDARAYDILKDCKNVVMANNEDFYTEYGDAIISVKTVDSIDEAIAHINECSTHHSESILTSDEINAKRFQVEIDSSSVYVNASTRFTDGFVFGLGAEIGIATQKLHARGPMGLDALTTSKYFVKGEYSVRK